MRRLFLLVALAVLASCARAPRAVEPVPGPATPIRPTGGLFGVTSSDLIARFGQPGFQVREGPGTKLQWSQNGCVLDAYLYPPPNGQGVARVTHVDARRPSGADLDLDSCIALLDR
jgi:hypothetical protein